MVTCDFKEMCRNENKKCWFCDRNQDKDILLDNFESRSIHSVLDPEKWANSTTEKPTRKKK